MQIIPFVERSFGALVLGANLARFGGFPGPTAAQASELRDAFLKHRVLVFHSECTGFGRATEEEEVELFRVFDEPWPEEAKDTGHHGSKRDGSLVFKVTNVHAPGEIVESLVLRKDELPWHTDQTYRTTPGKLGMLYAREVPACGSPTDFCDMTAAYNALDDSMKSKLAQARAVHRHPSRTDAGRVLHPIFRTHAETGEKSIYVNPLYTERLEDRAPESEGVLEELFGHCTQPGFVMRHHWSPGEVLLWDNRCTMHKRIPFEGNRMMWRVTSRGDPPPETEDFRVE